MRTYYTNLPRDFSKEKTLQEFEGYQSIKGSVNPTIYNAMIGALTSKGFGQSAAELVTETIMMQAKIDGYNSMELLDSIKKLNKIEINGIISEIINYNRYKSSCVGYYTEPSTTPEISRNIIR